MNEVRKKFICIENKGVVLQENIAEIFYVEINDIQKITVYKQKVEIFKILLENKNIVIQILCWC